MAEKFLKSTDDASLKKKKRKKATDDDELIDNVYKMNFEQDDLDLTSRKVKELQDTQMQMQEALLSLQNAQQNLEENDSSQVALKEQSVLQQEQHEQQLEFRQEQVDGEIELETKSAKKTANSRKKSNKNIIKVVDDDEDEDIDDIFGNVNKWLTDDDLEETIKEQKSKARKKRLTKIEEGIKSSKKSKTAKASTTKSTKRRTKKQIEEEQAINDMADFANVTNTINTTSATGTTNTENMTMGQTSQDDAQGEIKIHAENDVTEILLRHNQYKIELQKLEYNIYTEKNETSYIIVRDSGLRIVSGNDYLFLQKQGEDYEVTTNQDFKINYVIDNLARRDNTVNFKLTNLTQIVADENGLVFEIDEEKVIENNLEDNHTLVISEEDGKVYLPYTKEDVKNEVLQNKGSKISDVIEDKYIMPLDKYKNSIRARFREGYNLMYKREGKSKRSAIMLGIELMFETNLHPAIISACKNLQELDIYLDCLEDNELEKFSCFKIIYKSLPTLRKKAKYQEF